MKQRITEEMKHRDTEVTERRARAELEARGLSARDRGQRGILRAKEPLFELQLTPFESLRG